VAEICGKIWVNFYQITRSHNPENSILQSLAVINPDDVFSTFLCH